MISEALPALPTDCPATLPLLSHGAVHKGSPAPLAQNNVRQIIFLCIIGYQGFRGTGRQTCLGLCHRVSGWLRVPLQASHSAGGTEPGQSRVLKIFL